MTMRSKQWYTRTSRLSNSFANNSIGRLLDPVSNKIIGQATGGVKIAAAAGVRGKGKKGFQGKETVGFVPLGLRSTRTPRYEVTLPCHAAAAIRNFKYLWLGFFSFFAWFGGGSFFEVHGKNSIQENVAGCIALVLYIVLGQFLLPRDPTADTAEDWRVRACMAAPLVAFALLMLATEQRSTILPKVSMLAAGCIGVLLGGILARSLTRSAPADAARAAGMSRLLGNTGAALYVGVSVILFALAVPALNGTARGGTMVVAVLHVVLAAAVLWRTRQGKAPIFAAMFGFLMTMLLAGIGASYMAHGPTMRLASIPHGVCAAMDMVVCGCCVGVAIQRRDVPSFLEGHP